MAQDDPVWRVRHQLQEVEAVAALLRDDALALRVRRLLRMVETIAELEPVPTIPQQRRPR